MAQPEDISGPLSLLILGTPHRGSHCRDWAPSALPSLPPTACTKSRPVFPEHVLNLDSSWAHTSPGPLTGFLPIPCNASSPTSCLWPGPPGHPFRTQVRLGQSPPRGQSPTFLSLASISSVNHYLLLGQWCSVPAFPLLFS